MNYYGYDFIRESDLTHHGIKGQKWGQRRFQNEDGTWTAAGKERYGDGAESTRSSRGSAPGFSGASRKSSTSVKQNDPEHQKRVETIKKVAKVGAAVAGTALVAYGAYKLNDKLNDNIRKEYLNKGMDWVRKSSELTRIANESAKNLKRDTDNFKSSPAWQDPANSKYAPAYLRGLELRGQHAQQQLNSAVAARSRATQYYEKAKQDNYSLAEKRDALKRMARRK